MAEQQGGTRPTRDEKDEKDEKEEKREEKEEKSREEKWARDPLSGIVWAAILIWAGLVLLADSFKLLQDVSVLGSPLRAWSLIFAGAGVIVLLEVCVRLVVPVYRRPVIGTFIFGVILLGIGLGDTIGWSVFWPVILIAIGIAILIGGLFRRW